MRGTIRYAIGSLTADRLPRAALEILLYAAGAGVLFYLVDVLFMRWQGLALH